MRRGWVAWLCASSVAGAIGCGGNGSGTPRGQERGPCLPDSSCAPGLTCLSDLCVRVVGNDAGANPGTAGGGFLGGGGFSGGAGSSGGGGSAGGGGGTFPVAPHPPLPQLADIGGPVLTAPKLRPIFFGGDPDQAEIMSFLTELAGGSYWRATTSEYGVGPITVLPAITGLTASSGTIDDSALQAAIAANTSSLSPPWGAPDPGTIYLFVIPPSITLTFGTEACCTSFGGYHYETNVNGAALPYVAACACPNFFGAGWSQIDERTGAMSHELVEVATDPFPRSDPAFSQANLGSYIWTAVTGGEAADMCVVEAEAFTTLPGSSHVVQRSWSNAAAKADRDPCVPAPTSTPYFNSMPVLDVIAIDGGSGYETHGLLIPIGASRTIDLDLFSNGTVARDWNVSLYNYEDLFGGTPSLALSLDRTSGNNGEVLRLTITPLRTNPVLGVDAFVIYSSTGTPGSAGFQSHVAMGLVTTN
jgi:hypothetical protein